MAAAGWFLLGAGSVVALEVIVVRHLVRLWLYTAVHARPPGGLRRHRVGAYPRAASPERTEGDTP